MKNWFGMLVSGLAVVLLQTSFLAWPWSWWWLWSFGQKKSLSVMLWWALGLGILTDVLGLGPVGWSVLLNLGFVAGEFWVGRLIGGRVGSALWTLGASLVFVFLWGEGMVGWNLVWVAIAAWVWMKLSRAFSEGSEIRLKSTP